MTVFDLSAEQPRRLGALAAPTDLYEQHVESLLWDNLEEFAGIPSTAPGSPPSPDRERRAT